MTQRAGERKLAEDCLSKRICASAPLHHVRRRAGRSYSTRAMESQLRARAADLGLQDAEVVEWEATVDDTLVTAVLGALIGYEDALAELAT